MMASRFNRRADRSRRLMASATSPAADGPCTLTSTIKRDVAGNLERAVATTSVTAAPWADVTTATREGQLGSGFLIESANQPSSRSSPHSFRKAALRFPSPSGSILLASRRVLPPRDQCPILPVTSTESPSWGRWAFARVWLDHMTESIDASASRRLKNQCPFLIDSPLISPRILMDEGRASSRALTTRRLACATESGSGRSRGVSWRSNGRRPMQG